MSTLVKIIYPQKENDIYMTFHDPLDLRHTVIQPSQEPLGHKDPFEMSLFADPYIQEPRFRPNPSPLAHDINDLVNPFDAVPYDVGSGTYGIVTGYNNHDVVVKHTREWSGLNRSFLREVSALTALRGSPSIMPIKGFDPTNGQIFMPKANGDLHDWINNMNDDGTQPLKIQNFMGQIETGLISIHKNGFWHRDLKPDNILLHDDDQVWITDFGQTVATPNQYTDHTNPVYAIHYRAPEILENPFNEYYDGVKCDIFAFGIIFFHLLTQYQCKKLTSNDEESVDGEKDVQLRIQLQMFKAYLKNKHTVRALVKPWCQSEPAIDLLSQLLHLDPLQRIDHDGILRHPYFEGYKFKNLPGKIKDWRYPRYQPFKPLLSPYTFTRHDDDDVYSSYTNLVIRIAGYTFCKIETHYLGMNILRYHMNQMVTPVIRTEYADAVCRSQFYSMVAALRNLQTVYMKSPLICSKSWHR